MERVFVGSAPRLADDLRATGRAARWRERRGPGVGRLVLSLGLGQPVLQLLNALRVHRMIAQKAWSFGAAAFFIIGRKPFPKVDRRSWIIPGARHINQPNVIGF